MRVPKVMKRMIGNSHRDLPGLEAVLKSQRDESMALHLSTSQESHPHIQKLFEETRDRQKENCPIECSFCWLPLICQHETWHSVCHLPLSNSLEDSPSPS